MSFKAIKQKRPHNYSSVEYNLDILSGVNPDEADSMVDVLRDESFSATDIAEASNTLGRLNPEWGLENLSTESIRRYRKRFNK